MLGCSFPRLLQCLTTVPLDLALRVGALLLRLSAHRGGSVAEIGRRTVEVLDQLERNEDQQQVLLTIIEVLDDGHSWPLIASLIS